MRKITAFILLVLILSSCTPEPAPQVTAGSVTPTPGRILVQTGISTPTITPVLPTRTPIPSYTPRPTNTLPTPTPTFDPLHVVTATRAPAAVCPQPAGNPPQPDFIVDRYAHGDIDKTLDYLNQYGPDLIVQTLVDLGKREGFDFLYRDLTNDGVPELGISIRGFEIFGCVEGNYEEVVEVPDDGRLSIIPILSIEDINKNGIPEVLLDHTPLGLAAMPYGLLEWNGIEYKNLFEIPDDSVRGDHVHVWTDISLVDLEGDGIQEYVWDDTGIPELVVFRDGLPWRPVTNYFKWNGQVFQLYKKVYGSPEYRFQAVQDADDAVMWGEYDRALALYQDVIFSDLLKPWSPELRDFEYDASMASYGGYPTPYPPPAADPDELPNLAAYARYKIMLLHVARGYLPEAEIVYNTLQEKFPEGQPGHIYAGLAQEFWEEYLVSQNIEQSCSAAIQFAEDHVDTIFYYISSNYHGDQSRRYEPEDICPFK